jgi:hypothetical protein
MQSVSQTKASNKLARHKPDSFSRGSEITKQQIKEMAKGTRGKGGKSCALWKSPRRKQDGRRAAFQKEKGDSVKNLRRIKRRLFLDAVKSPPRQLRVNDQGKKNRTGQE